MSEGAGRQMCSLSIEIEVFGRSLLVQDQVSSLCSSFDALCLHEGAVQSLILWFQVTLPQCPLVIVRSTRSGLFDL